MLIYYALCIMNYESCITNYELFIKKNTYENQY